MLSTSVLVRAIPATHIIRDRYVNFDFARVSKPSGPEFLAAV